MAAILEMKDAEMEEKEAIFVQMERMDNAERDCLVFECKDFRSMYISIKERYRSKNIKKNHRANYINLQSNEGGEESFKTDREAGPTLLLPESGHEIEKCG